MDPTQVERDEHGVMRCHQCGFAYNLDAESVAAESEEGLLAVEAAVREAPEDIRSTRPEPRVWSVNAYTAHLKSAATVISSRVAAILAQDRPALAYYDQDEEAEASNTDAIPAGESAAALRPVVERFVSVVRLLPAEAWDRVGLHERAGEVRLSEIAHDMPHELRHHAQDIRSVGRRVSEST